MQRCSTTTTCPSLLIPVCLSFYTNYFALLVELPSVRPCPPTFTSIGRLHVHSCIALHMQLYESCKIVPRALHIWAALQ